MKILSTILLSTLLVACGSVAPATQGGIRSERIAAQRLAVRTFRGAYEQHVPATAALLERARAAGIEPVVVGVYPHDPDGVGRENTIWHLGLLLPAHKEAAFRDDAELRIEEFPATSAATIESTVGTSRTDGLRLLAWIAEHEYVQTGPTRMIYWPAAGNPLQGRTTIIVPVQKRPAEIAAGVK